MGVSVKICLLCALAVFTCGWTGVKGKEIKIKDSGVIIPADNVNDGKAHYYFTKLNGKTIRFFLVKSDDNVIRAAFDACDVCYSSRKGYSQHGNFMVCNNCGMRFHSRKINEVQGGCNPSPLIRTLNGGNIQIKTDDILSGAMYF